MNTRELRELTADELMEALIEAKEERFNLRFQVATNQLDNTARLKTVKKDIARILTVIGEKEVATPTPPHSDMSGATPTPAEENA